MNPIAETWQTLKFMRTPENQPILPIFPRIDPADIPPGSGLVFQGLPGNKATERICAHKYGSPFHSHFHAALMRRDLMFHNVGKYRSEEPLDKELRSERRIDVITYKAMTEADRAAIMRACAADTSRPHTLFQVTDYGVRTFIHQGFRFIKAGKKAICSENVVRLLQTRGILSSYEIPQETAPFELMLFAIRNPDLCEIRTVWVGEDFARKSAERQIYKGCDVSVNARI